MLGLSPFLEELENVSEAVVELRRAAQLLDAAQLIGVGVALPVDVGDKAGMVRLANDHLGVVVVEVHLEDRLGLV